MSSQQTADSIQTPSQGKAKRRMHRSTVQMLAVALVAVCFVTMIGYTTAWGMKVGRLERMSKSDVFSTMDLKTLDGGTFTSANLKDARITIFNVWGTTCAPCVLEMPDLETLNHSYEPGQIQVVGILEDSTDMDGVVQESNLDQARVIIQKVKVTYPTLIMDKSTKAFVNSTIVGTPTTFIVDQNGEVLATITGAQPLKDMQQRVDEVLQTAK